MNQAPKFRRHRARDAVTDLGAVLLIHYNRTARSREEAVSKAFDALLGHVKVLAETSPLVERLLRERCEELRAIERRASGQPLTLLSDEASLL